MTSIICAVQQSVSLDSRKRTQVPMLAARSSCQETISSPWCLTMRLHTTALLVVMIVRSGIGTWWTPRVKAIKLTRRWMTKCCTWKKLFRKVPRSLSRNQLGRKISPRWRHRALRTKFRQLIRMLQLKARATSLNMPKTLLIIILWRALSKERLSRALKAPRLIRVAPRTSTGVMCSVRRIRATYMLTLLVGLRKAST